MFSDSGAMYKQSFMYLLKLYKIILNFPKEVYFQTCLMNTFSEFNVLVLVTTLPQVLSSFPSETTIETTFFYRFCFDIHFPWI